MTKEKSIIDYAGLDPAVRDLLPRYMGRRENDIAKITDLLGAQKFDEIRVLAHNMHGSGAAYGVKRISEIGREMEKAARDADAEAIRTGVDALRIVLAKFHAG